MLPSPKNCSGIFRRKQLKPLRWKSGHAFASDDVVRRLNPYLRHYSPAFASSTLLYPHSHQFALQRTFPSGGEVRAYHVPPE